MDSIDTQTGPLQLLSAYAERLGALGFIERTGPAAWRIVDGKTVEQVEAALTPLVEAEVMRALR